MAESRKVFPMNTFYAYISGEGLDAKKKEVSDLLGFMINAEIDEQAYPFAAAVAKAWIYEQDANLIKLDAAKAAKLGGNVSLPPLPEGSAAEVQAIIAKFKEVSAANTALTGKVAEYEKKLADDAAKIKDLSAKLKVFEDKAKEGDKKFEVSEKKINDYMAKQDDYIKKLDELLAKIDAVKKAGVVVQGVAAAPGAAGEAPAEEAAPAAEAEVDFGFGGSGDPFAGDATW